MKWIGLPLMALGAYGMVIGLWWPGPLVVVIGALILGWLVVSVRAIGVLLILGGLTHGQHLGFSPLHFYLIGIGSVLLLARPRRAKGEGWGFDFDFDGGSGGGGSDGGDGGGGGD